MNSRQLWNSHKRHKFLRLLAVVVEGDESSQLRMANYNEGQTC